MFFNYLKTTLRHLLRHKGSAALNVAGLAIGLASSTLILMYVQYELSYDTFHEKADRIYRVYKQDPGNIFLGTDYFAVVPAPLGKAMEEDFPEVESTVKFAGSGTGLIRVDGKSIMETGMLWAEPAVFGIFDIRLIKGDAATALQEPNTVVLSEEVARRHFGDKNPMGEMMRIRDQYDMRVTGVMKDIPKNSHVTASMLLSFATYEAERRKDMNWGNSSYYTFVLLREGSDPDAIREKFPAFAQKHMGDRFKEWEREPTRFFLQPLTDIHLGSTFINFGPGGEGDARTIYILSALTIILLATASINYTNLATARASLRAREVGVRKVIGAGRNELIRQFIGESLLTALIAGCAALMIVEISLGSFARLVDRELPLSIFSDGAFIPGFVLLTALVGVVSGIYPAIILSGFAPVEVFKSVTGGRQRTRFRDALVVVQFSAGIALAICAFVILNQLTYIRNSDPGYNRDQVLSVRLMHRDVIKALPAFLNKVSQLPGVAGFTTSTHLPIQVGSSTGLAIIGDDGQKREAQSYQMYTDENFLDVYKIPLLAGRFFNGAPLAEDEDPTDYIVNETFVRTFGLKDPVGRVIERSGRKVTIIGVVKDFHMHNFRQDIAPLFITKRGDRWVSYASIRLRPPAQSEGGVRAGGLSETLEQIKQAWRETVSDYPFDYAFVDESFQKMYERDEKLGQIVTSFTALALFVGAMGLFGLATFVAQVRRKEIGIRKVLGATSSSVAALLSREFMVLVGVANLIAWPVAYFVMDGWLSDFAYRISLGPGLFLLAGAAAALIAMITVSTQAIRAAGANPVESLRYE